MTEMALYPVDEVRGLYATISALRQRLQQLGDSAHLGQADVVLLRAMDGREMTRRELAIATGMHADYLHVRLYRLRAAGLVEMAGRRPRSGKGNCEWTWRRVLANASVQRRP